MTKIARFTFLDRLLFDAAPEQYGQSAASARRIVLLLLYAAGLYAWLAFYSFGNIDFRVSDWSAQHVKFYMVLQERIAHLQIPYYASQIIIPEVNDTFEMHEFLAFLNVPVSPQVLALAVLPIHRYVILNLLLFYSLGFWGCLSLARHLRLALFPFAILWLLFNFNGHVVSHLAAGHPEWVCCFVLPFYFLLLLRLNEQKNWVRDSLLMSLLFCFMMLNGAIHLTNGAMLFLAICVVGQMNRKAFASFLLIAGMTAVLSAVKILPALAVLKSADGGFFLGYESFDTLVQATTVIRNFEFPRPEWQAVLYRQRPAPWWEYNHYISLIGLVFLLVFGVVLPLRKRANEQLEGRRFGFLAWAIVILIVLSMNMNYIIVKNLGIPFLSHVERVPARFLLYPLLALTVIACSTFQDCLSRGLLRPGDKVLGLGALVYMAALLMQHFDVWRHDVWKPKYQHIGIFFDPMADATGSNAVYELAVNGGIITSLLALMIWIWIYRRAKRHGQEKGHRQDARATL